MGLVSLLAATAEEGHSEAPFLIAGSVLAAFAVAVSVIGFMRPSWPGTDGAARAVIGVGTVLVVVAAAMVIYIAG